MERKYNLMRLRYINREMQLKKIKYIFAVGDFIWTVTEMPEISIKQENGLVVMHIISVKRIILVLVGQIKTSREKTIILHKSI